MRGYGYETNGYHRAVEDEYEDEFYDQDEYEEEGSGAEDGYVEEEEPTEGQREILELRERLKEQIRQKAKAAAATTVGRSSSSQIPATRDKFGSFFGPSKPVISQRVIEERKSLKELHSTISRDPRPSGVHKDTPSSSKVQNKGNGHQHKPKIINEVKRKAEALKDNRDYSFLLSDDADLSPSPKEKPAVRPSLAQKADREVLHSAVKSKAPSQPAKLLNGHGSKSTLSTQRLAEGRVDSMRKEVFLNRERAVSRSNDRMQSVVRNGSNHASTSKTIQKLPNKSPIPDKYPSKDLNDPTLRKSSISSRHHLSEIDRPKSLQSQRIQSAGQRPQHSSHGQKPQQSMQQRPQQLLHSRRPQQASQGQKPQQSLQQRSQQSLQSQRLQQSSNVQKMQSSQTQRSQSLSNRSQPLQGQRPLSSQGQYSDPRRVQANDRVKQAERQIRPPSKPMPSRPISSNGIRDEHAKRKQVAKRRFDDDDDEENPFAMIRNMFGYDPSRYAGRDEDDSDMEADFATIEREEKRSARIARQEDEEQLRLIEEEERREQERKRRKMARGR